MLMAYYPSDGKIFYEKKGAKRVDGKESLAISEYPRKIQLCMCTYLLSVMIERGYPTVYIWAQ